MMAEAKWYVIHTYSGYENKVATTLQTMVDNRNLNDMICEVTIPMEHVTEIGADGKTKEIDRKIFPGYVLVKMVMTEETWFIVRNIKGCTGFVGSATDPVPLTAEEVAKFGVEKTSVSVRYAQGDTVNIIDGPLEGFSGIVTELDIHNNSVRVTISMFGRENTVDLELGQVELSKEA